MIINVTAIEAEGRHSPLSVQRESRMPGEEERHSAEFGPDSTLNKFYNYLSAKEDCIQTRFHTRSTLSFEMFYT